MAQHTFASSLVVGSSSSVSDAVAATVAGRTSDPANATRIGGADRYDTSAAVATAVFPDATTVVIATGDKFPDALAGVPAADVNAAPVLLLPQACTPASLATYVQGIGTTPAGARRSSTASPATCARQPDLRDFWDVIRALMAVCLDWPCD